MNQDSEKNLIMSIIDNKDYLLISGHHLEMFVCPLNDAVGVGVAGVVVIVDVENRIKTDPDW